MTNYKSINQADVNGRPSGAARVHHMREIVIPAVLAVTFSILTILAPHSAFANTDLIIQLENLNPTQNIYVSSSGSDDEDGTIDHPVATLDRAFNKAIPGDDTYVILKDDITVKKTAFVHDGQKITLRTFDDNDAEDAPNTLLRDVKFKKYMIEVWPEAELTIGNVILDGNGENVQAMFSLIANDGTLTLSGGSIVNNNNSDGPGGGVYNEATFTMLSGSITGNIAWIGGGVENYEGTFLMQDGIISVNQAEMGGGVYNEGSLEVEGGQIVDNTPDNISES